MARPRSNRPDARSNRPGGGPPRRPAGSSGGPRRPTGEGRRDDGPPRERRSFQPDEGRPPRRDDRDEARSRDDRGPARSRDDRGPARSRDDRGPARSRDDRGPARSRDDRGPARSRDDRGPDRREEGSKPPRHATTAAPRKRPRVEPLKEEGPERLQKILAQAGVGSRRACELLILEGRVTVDGQVANELGAKFDPATAKIAVDGQKIQPEKFAYYLVYKPKGYVSTSSDPSGRPLVQDLIPKAKERIFIVGRLDRHSEGLMLLTNDGALAQRLTHPKFGVEKTYRVTVAGEAGNEIVQKLTDGVWLAEGKVRARRARIVSKRGNATVLEVVLAEGKNREIRRMLARLDHKVLSLLRVSIGPLQLKGLSEGAWRSLSESEVERLRSGDLFSDEGERSPGEPRRPQKPRPQPGIDHQEPRSQGRFDRDDQRRDRRDDRPARPVRPRPTDENEGGDEEVVFTDRMDAGGDDSPRRSHMALDSHRDRPARSEGRNYDRPARSEGRSFDRPARPEGRSYDRPPRPEGRSYDRPPAGRGRPERGGEGRPPRGPGRDRDRDRDNDQGGRPPRGEGRSFDRARPEGRSFDRPQRDERPRNEGRPPRRDDGPARREGGSPMDRRGGGSSGPGSGPASGPKRRSGPAKGLPPRRRRPS